MYKLSVLVSCSHIEFANWFVAGLCRGCEIKCCWLKKHRRIEQNSYLNCACMIYVPLIRSFALTPHDSIWVCTHSQHTEWEWCSCYCFYKHSFACTLAIIYFGISLFGNSGVHTQHTYNCWMKKKTCLNICKMKWKRHHSRAHLIIDQSQWNIQRIKHEKTKQNSKQTWWM